MNKKELREFMKVKRSATLPGQKDEMDSAIFYKVINSEAYKKASVIFIYVSFGAEVDTHRIINQSLEDNKTVCVPKVINRAEGMKAVEIASVSELKESKLGILEPVDISKEIMPGDINLAIIPGLAFDRSGGRIGYGAGYYDRFLLNLNPKASKIGIAYKLQIIESVPMDKTDVYIDQVITE